jgi:protein-disulfide isomerase
VAVRKRPPLAGRLVAALLAAIGVVWAWLASPAGAQDAPVPREAIEQVVRDYLLRHPEVVIEALQRAEAQRREAARQRTRQAVLARRQELLHDPASPVGGNPAGSVTVVEFFDYRCPHCRRMAPVLKALLAEDPGIRLVFKEWPILGPDSVVAARAALAAAHQGRYVDAHDRLMGEPGSLTAARAVRALVELGLEEGRLRVDMERPEVAAALGRVAVLAEALGIDGTPALVVGDELVIGAVDLDTLRALVTRARQGR